MFSRPVSSGWNPVPTSSRLPTRPSSSRPAPSWARRSRLRIFSSVLLPAPLRPMIADRLAGGDVEGDVVERPERLPDRSLERVAEAPQRGFRHRVRAQLGRGDLVVLPEPRALIARSDDIGELPFHPSEAQSADEEQHHARRPRWHRVLMCSGCPSTRHQRKPSRTPTSGFSAKRVRTLSGTASTEYAIGLM